MGTEKIVNRDLVRTLDITWYLQKFNQSKILCALLNEGRYCVTCPVPSPPSTWCVRGCHLQLWLLVSLHQHPGISTSFRLFRLSSFLLLKNYLFISCSSLGDSRSSSRSLSLQKRERRERELRRVCQPLILCVQVCVLMCVCVCVSLKPRP